MKPSEKITPLSRKELGSLLLALILSCALFLYPAAGPSQEDLKNPASDQQVQTRRILDDLIEQRAPRLSLKERQRIVQSIEQNTAKYQIDPFLIMALIRIESNFDPQAQSRIHALGLMQIRPFVGEALARDLKIQEHKEEDLYQIERNIDLGTAYLSRLLKRFDYNLVHALCAYNHGPTKIREMLQADQTLPTKYAQKVLTAYQGYTLSPV